MGVLLRSPLAAVPALLCGGLLLVGCSTNFGVELPESYPLSVYTQGELMGSVAEDPDQLVTFASYEDRDALASAMEENFGTPTVPNMKPEYMSDERYQSVYRGARLYHEHCTHCHGLAGAGDGPTAEFLNPPPRDYRQGKFKWKSTDRNAKPTRDDLRGILHDGAIGTSMPPFRLLPPQDIEDLIDYVIFLSQRGETERKLLTLYLATEEMPDEDMIDATVSQVVSSWEQADDAIVPVDDEDGAMPDYTEGTPEFEAAFERGRRHYLSEVYGCYKCHGLDGRADPSQMAESERQNIIDDWGNRNLPRNLVLGMFRGGRRPVDIYRRLHQGIAGAQMPAQATNPKREAGDLWDLVLFVRALPYRPHALETESPATESAEAKDSHGQASSH